MNKTIYSLFSILCTIILSFVLQSNKNGISASYFSGCGGGGCHGTSKNSSTTISLKFNGNTITQYDPGVKYTVTYTVSNSSYTNSSNKCGFNIYFSKGNLANPSTGSALASAKEIVHNAPKTMTNGSGSWTSEWTAPAKGSGSVQITIAGNATNGDNGTTGDAWNTTTLLLSEKLSSRILDQNSQIKTTIFPNPASDYLSLRSSHVLDLKKAVVSNLEGKIFSISAVNKTADDYQIDISSLSNGRYFLRLDSDELLPFQIAK